MSLKDTYNSIRTQQGVTGKIEHLLMDFAFSLDDRKQDFITALERGVPDEDARKYLSSTHELPKIDLDTQESQFAFEKEFRWLSSYRFLLRQGEKDDMCFDFTLETNPSGTELTVTIDPDKEGTAYPKIHYRSVPSSSRSWGATLKKPARM